MWRVSKPTALITGFSSTLSSSSIFAIEEILLVDALVTPTLNLLDLPGLLNRYVLARLSPTQRKMNTYFLVSEGAPDSLQEH
jgi:hypothetical protein